jgi:fermentation-respiration switch protein FrsA (DUF1100 family)
VKEQSSGLYAQTMAERGFVTLAFDPSYTGESGGEPRNVASPDINTEDFRRRSTISACTLRRSRAHRRHRHLRLGRHGAERRAVDKRVKAVVASTMYDMTRVMSKGYNDSVTPEQRTQTLEQLSRQRWKDAERGPGLPAALQQAEGRRAQFLVDYHDYYRRRAATTRARSTRATPGRRPRRCRS